VLDLYLIVVRDAGEVDPAVPLHQLLVVRLELLELMFGQGQSQFPGSFNESLHHGRFMIAQGLTALTEECGRRREVIGLPGLR